MELELSDEQRLLLQTVRRFVKEQILPLEDKLDPDADEIAPEDHHRLVAQVKDMGLYGLGIPAEYGGPAIDLVTHSLLEMEISQHRAGLYAPCYGVFGGSSLAQLYEANQDQKERYLYPTLRGEKTAFFALTEATGGSDPARAIRTTAVRDGEDWVINGSKMFISGADRVNRARIPYAAACLGVAMKAQEMSIEYAKVRKTFGDLLATRQAIQWMIVDNEIDIRSARWLVLEAACKAEHGHPFQTEAALAKLVASEAVGRVVDRAIQIHG